MALSLNPLGEVLGRVDRTLAAVDRVVSDVRALLRELQSELALLHRLPEIAAQLDEVHRIVAGGEARRSATDPVP